MKSVTMFFLITFMFLLSYAAAQDFKNISAEELKHLIDQKEKMVLVDARTVGEFQDGHIPTAINISPEKINEISRYLPENKDQLIIFYGRGGS
jgi:phage shock protein E